MKKKSDDELAKIAMMPDNAKFDVKIDQTVKFTKDEYLLYCISLRAYEEQRKEMEVGNMSFDEYVLRTFIFGIGSKIAEDLSQAKMGHA